jgi:hypothetical protein
MSHIDEGELTAYADGAYAPEDADAQRIAMHIAECANCRNRVAEAQRLSGRASEILAVATPVSMDAPPFEHIAASAAPRARRRFIPMTWAASIVLAAGLGWFGRDALYNPDAGLQMSERQVLTDSNVIESAAPMPRIEEESATAPSPAPASARTRAGEGAGVSSPAVREADRRTEAAASDLSSEVAGGRAAGSVTSQVAADAARESQPMAKVGEAAAPTAAAPPPSAAPATAARRLEAEAQKMAAAEAADETIEYITPAEAEARKLNLHVIPELEVVRIGLIGSGVRVEQKLPDGKIVTLEAERAAIDRQERDAANAAKTAEGVRAPVSVMRAGTRITISGALTADSLRALSARIR